MRARAFAWRTETRVALKQPATLSKTTEAITRRVGVDVAETQSYRVGFVRMTYVVNVLGVVIFFFLALFLFILYTQVPQDRYIAETADGQQMQMIGLEQPNINTQTLLDWGSEAATQIMTFGFNDYDNKLSQARTRFTMDGWLSFAPKMANSEFFKKMVSEQQLVTAVPRSSATLFSEGVDKGRYFWIVEVPLLVSVRSGGQSRPINITVRMVVVRVPTAENPAGIGIDRWISF